jgi:DNA-binding NtrC family response regulator
MSAPAVQTKSLPILVIEDEPAVMGYVRAALEREGYEVVGSENGVEGLRQLASREFMGVVSDVRTPGGVDGADVYAWISKNRPALAARVLLITGDIANQETVGRLRRTGVPCLEKPFRLQAFLSLVEQTIGRARV